MTIRIFKNGALINNIVSDEAFVKYYCEKHGYTYEIDPESIIKENASVRKPSEFEKLCENVIQDI